MCERADRGESILAISWSLPAYSGSNWCVSEREKDIDKERDRDRKK
jgi:hypothetical protein